MADDCAVEFLAGSAASPQLKELDRIRAVSDSLPALGPHLAWALQGVVGLPVLLARRLLHQHKGSIFQAPHQIVAHGRETPGRVVGRVVVPGDDIHLFCPFEIVQLFISTHEVCGDDGLFVVFPDSVPLVHVVLKHAVRIEPLVVDGETGKSAPLIPETLA